MKIILEFDKTKRKLESHLGGEWISNQCDKLLGEDVTGYRIRIPVAFIVVDQRKTCVMYEGEDFSDINFIPNDLIGNSIVDQLSILPLKHDSIDLALNGELIEEFVKCNGQVWAIWYFPLRDQHHLVVGAICVFFNFSNHKHKIKQAASLAFGDYQFIAEGQCADTAGCNVELVSFLKILLDQFVKEIGVDAGRIFLHDTKNKSLKFAAKHGYYDTACSEEQFQSDISLTRYVALKRRPFITQNLSRTRHFYSSEQLDFTGERYVFYCGMPLIFKGHFLGVLELFHYQSLDVNSLTMSH